MRALLTLVWLALAVSAGIYGIMAGVDMALNFWGPLVISQIWATS